MTKLNIWEGEWWLNFCLAHRNEKHSLHLDEINERLELWGGRIHDINAVTIQYVEFANDADATAFMLRWA